ncbi:two-component system histidine kinase PnpS [Alicyclobacillus macrosporangiidus]|nr:ATP-binding protein [Alicyclobacillus macrosporangiidus]
MGNGPVGFALGLLTAAGGMLGYWGIRTRRGRLFWEHVRDVVTRVRQGDRQARVLSYAGEVRPDVAQMLNDMLDALEDQVNRQSEEQRLLQYVLNAMTTGVVYVDAFGNVQMLNPVAARILRKDADEARGRPYWEVFPDYALNAAICRTLLIGSPWRNEIRLPGDVVVDVHVIRLEDAGASRDTWQEGFHVLVLCNDVTQWHRMARMRSDFIANVSHELKTPITAIRGFAETLVGEDVDESTRDSFLQVIYEESLRMSRLVEDLLTLSRLETQEMHLEWHPVQLSAVVEMAVDRLQPQLQARHLTLRVQSEGDVTVCGDEDKLLQVMLNLLTNAMRYTPPGGCVSVTWETFPDQVKVHVADTGIGIPEEEQKRVFERFYRVNADRSRASGGTGLGLAIVKHIVRSYGGEVGVRSRVGFGSDFWFTLQRCKDPASSDTASGHAVAP